MYRIVKMSGQWYAKKFEEEYIEYELEAITSFANEGSPVVIIDDLESFCLEFGIDEDEIQVVE